MPKRSKRRFKTEGDPVAFNRSTKGIESISEQIELHKQKLRLAEKSGNIGLADYYEKEIESLESALKQKQVILKGK